MIIVSCLGCFLLSFCLVPEHTHMLMAVFVLTAVITSNPTYPHVICFLLFLGLNHSDIYHHHREL
jgi:hypothetical protein